MNVFYVYACVRTRKDMDSFSTAIRIVYPDSHLWTRSGGGGYTAQLGVRFPPICSPSSFPLPSLRPISPVPSSSSLLRGCCVSFYLQKLGSLYSLLDALLYPAQAALSDDAVWRMSVSRLSRTSGRRAAYAAGRLDGAYWLIGPGSAGLAQGCRCAIPLQARAGAYRCGRPPTACYI